MPTLLQINVSSNYGSTGKIAEQIGLLAQQNDWTCYLAHGARFYNKSKLITYQIDSYFGECIHKGIYSLLFDKDGLGSEKATLKLITFINEVVKPDIVHLHNIHGYFINYNVLFKYLEKIKVPVVWTLHDCWPFTGHCTHFELSRCIKWKTECFSCPQKKETPPSLFLDSSQSNYRLKKNLFTSLGNKLTIVPVSNWLENLVKQSFLRNTSIVTIHNGIDLNAFKPISSESLISKFKLRNKIVLLGVAAPWSKRKGFYDFIKLRTLLSEQYSIILLGVSKLQKSKLPSGIIGLERTQNLSEMVQLYSIANILINPTYEDNYPTINLEAMACGTPVITYKTGGSPEAIGEGTGLIVEQGNIDSLVNAINEICIQDRESLKVKCRAHAELCFDNNKCFNEYLNLYNNILSK